MLQRRNRRRRGPHLSLLRLNGEGRGFNTWQHHPGGLEGVVGKRRRRRGSDTHE